MMSISQKFPMHAARSDAARVYFPIATIKSVGDLQFRSQLARDVACLFDIDEDVMSWSCQPITFAYGDEPYVADFKVVRPDRETLVFVVDDGQPPDWVVEQARQLGSAFELVGRNDLPVGRLRNAKDLLRYAGYDVPLGDRIRILAALEELGSLSVAECMSAFQETRAIAGLAKLILEREVEINLYVAISPETQVRRRRD
jgi:hypothetical protein